MARKKREDKLHDVDFAAVGSHFGLFDTLMKDPKVIDAVNKVRAAGIPWVTIIVVILPFIAQVLAGQKLDLKALIDAILALLQSSKK